MNFKIGDRVFVRGHIDEIRKDTVIIRNNGGYFGTIPSEVITGELPSAQQDVTDTNVGKKTCKTCHLWEDGELNIACPWGSNYEHYEDDYCSLWEKQN